jgi:hypothetical protein
MTKSLDPFWFLLITMPGWMKQQQLQLIEYLREGQTIKESCLERMIS